MVNSLHAILKRLEREPAVFLADQVACWPEGDLEHWLATGVLKPISLARSLPCLSCGGDHVGEVVFLDGAEPGQVRAYLPCPNCGPSPVNPLDLRRWRVDFLPLMEQFFGESMGKQSFSEINTNRLWRLGKVSKDLGSFTVFAGRQLHRSDAWSILQAARIPSKAVVLVPFHLPDFVEKNDAPLVLPLAEIVSDRGRVDLEDLGYRLQEWQERRASAGKRPLRRRSKRAEEIDALLKELREHLRTARDYAVTTRQQTGHAKLLPRPTQEDLARRLGIHQWTVSRCLNDSEARELQFLWNMAADEGRIMAFVGE